MSAPGAVLPETAAVHWRPRVDAARLHRRGRAWTATTLAHTIPFLLTAVVLIALEPLSFPVAIMAIVHAWMIPELYAARGSCPTRSPSSPSATRSGASALRRRGRSTLAPRAA